MRLVILCPYVKAVTNVLEYQIIDVSRQDLNLKAQIVNLLIEK